MTLSIGIDLDGCAYDFAGSLRRWLQRPDLPDPQCWDFYRDQWGMTTAEFTGHCADGVDAGHIFREGVPIDGAAEALAELQAAGHTLHIVTNRSYGSRSVQNTEEWLREHHIPFDSLPFAADKTLVRVDVFIEDNVENYLALTAAGVTAILFDRPWNRQLPTARRVRTWEMFVMVVEAIDAGTYRPAAPETILQEAQRLVHGNRGEDYGHPAQDFARTGRMWGAILGIPDVAPERVGLCMVALKISREVNKPKRDNRTDMAGYAETVDMVMEARR